MDLCRDSAASEDGSCPVMDDLDENYTVRDCTTVEANIFSDEVEENFSIDETIPEDPSAAENANGLDPYIGREFESEHATYLFYGEYARHVGFGIRKRFIRRSKLNNEVIGRTYVCSREDSLKLAEESSLTKERYRMAKIFLKEALMKVASMEKVPGKVCAFSCGGMLSLVPNKAGCWIAAACSLILAVLVSESFVVQLVVK
ncbi:Far1-related sequence 4-like, partial [Thalictrum thalictroides]